MAGETKVNVQRLKDIGTLIGLVVDEYRKPITDLGTVTPIAGQFDAAEWLEALFVDRRDAMVTHVKYLEMACKEMSEGLIAIAKEFDGLDSTNADAMTKFTASAKGIITGMASADYQPVPLKSKTSYETGDDAATGDEDQFDSTDPAHPKVKVVPTGALGMSPHMTLDQLGKENKSSINLANTPGISSGQPTELKTTASSGSNPGGTQPATTELQEPKVGMVGETRGKVQGSGEVSLRYYNESGQQQQTKDGKKIWWYNSTPYVATSASVPGYSSPNGQAGAPTTQIIYVPYKA